MAMRYEGTRKRMLTKLVYPDAGAHIDWVSAAKILRKKRKGMSSYHTQKEFNAGLGEEMPRWGHSHVPKE